MPAVVVPSGQQASPGERHCRLSSERHLFVVAYYFFEGGLTRPTFILDRQRHDPTKGRIRNTPNTLHKSQSPNPKIQGFVQKFDWVRQSKNTPSMPGRAGNASGGSGGKS